jgi:aspartyl aminopeptidase
MTERPNQDLGERFARSAEEMAALHDKGRAAAREMARYLDASPTPFHAVAETTKRLVAKGFTELSEREPWQLAKGDRRFVVRGGSTIVAFICGSEPPAAAGFTMIGAHTDSPCLRVKPNGDLAAKGYQQVGVEIYGGVLLSTWLDRDLSIAGRVMVQGTSGIEAHLVDLRRPVARVPNLAIHLNRGVNSEGLVLNQQRHMVPVIGLGREAALKTAIARNLGVEASAILGWDLSLYDTLGAALGGLGEEMIWSARLDNLASCFTATTALLEAADTSVAATRMVVLYDHEEVGSKSAVGAGGSILRDVTARVVDAYADGAPQALHRALARSWLISADMAHALHPNYDDKHEPQHQPQLNRGLVIKTNSNQSYATDGASAARFEALCHQVGYVPQRFVVRTDLPCGSTIGPITASELGVATVDVGGPMLSMHSCREMAGTLDVHLAIETFRRAFS